MKRMLRNWALAVLLALPLAIGLQPATALAEGTATVQINGQTLQDDVAVSCGEGTATLDNEAGTLTLENATLSQTTTAHPVVTVDNGELTVILIGENVITSADQRPFYCGSVNLTFQGSSNDSLTIETDSDGLQVDVGNMTIDGCVINIKSTSYGGMMCFGDYYTHEDGILTIKNGAKITIDTFNNALIGERGLFITDSTVAATARSNEEGWPTSAISSGGDMHIENSTVSATANGDEANAMSASGTIRIDYSNVTATTTSQDNPYTAICANGDISIANHSSVVASSVSTIGIWSTASAITIQDSIVHASAHDDWAAIQGQGGGATIDNSWVETAGGEISPDFTSTDSAIFFNNEGAVSGSLILPGNVTVDADMRLVVPEGSSLSIPAGITFSNHGHIELLGNLINSGGTVACDSHVGGTATCTAKAVCAICKSEYGDLLPHKLVQTEAEAATCTKEGNTEYWTCGVCGKVFSDATGEHEIAIESTVIPKTGHSWGEDGHCTACGTVNPDFAPAIIAGVNATWQKGSDKGLAFTSNAAYGDFQKVQVDGRDVAASDYTVEEGSTIVILKASCLETLSAGRHTLGIVSQTGTAETEFTIVAANQAPTEDTTSEETLAATGDASTPLATPLLVLASALIGAGALVRRRSRS